MLPHLSVRLCDKPPHDRDHRHLEGCSRARIDSGLSLGVHVINSSDSIGFTHAARSFVSILSGRPGGLSRSIAAEPPSGIHRGSTVRPTSPCNLCSLARSVLSKMIEGRTQCSDKGTTESKRRLCFSYNACISSSGCTVTYLSRSSRVAGVLAPDHAGATYVFLRWSRLFPFRCLADIRRLRSGGLLLW